MIKTGRAALAGVLGAAAMEALAFVAHQSKVSALSMSRYEGSIVTGRTDGVGSRAAGIGAHVLLSTLIALPYAAVLERSRSRTNTVGAQLGLVHWLVAGLALPGLDALNSTVRDGQTPRLRTFARGYGRGSVVMFLLGHLLYGVVVTRTYQSKAR
ncbi:hypothetical protein [Deinococcus peraridilitoris]|uniref:Uncharacterized protein n=1 Tax=Deinococcus peraridilitoris (strain DSM 19664 / LMG 22246 / CIP 109416 / KR-200) TaxID=937777 RepID=L0A858_DEIPD|nr:hypothetical protein [Deinococcus peraridilitoris]AFZ69250.1 hypothetical protein Deipe_3827 [Deinococcus peraridilitoris DSM 19664]